MIRIDPHLGICKKLTMEEQVEITCPYCAELVSIAIDVLVTHQVYFEDCSVCCRPIQIDVTCMDGSISALDIKAA